MAPDLNFKTNSSNKYREMKVEYIRICSTICIVCGMASICMQTATIAILLPRMSRYYVTFTSDLVGYGIWGGALNLIAGCLGITVTYVKEKTLLVALVVMATLSILASFIASLLSALAACLGFYSSCLWLFDYSTCDTWVGLEWALMGCGFIALISSIGLVILASGSLYACCRKHNGTTDMLQEQFEKPINL